MWGLYIKTAALQGIVAPDFGGVRQIGLYFLFFWKVAGGVEEGKTLERNIMVYPKKVSDYTTFTLIITWSFRYFNY